jgi:GWxTD domain-containing protein
MDDRINSILFSIMIIAFLKPFNVQGQLDFQAMNLALKYNQENNIPMQYQISKKDNTFIVLFSLELPDQVNFNEQYSLLYEIKDEYSSKNSKMNRTLNFPRSGIGEERGIKYFSIEIEEADDMNILFLRLKNNLSAIEYVWDIPLKGPLTYDSPDFFLVQHETQLPHLKSYLNFGKRLRIQPADSVPGTYYIYHYDQTFSAADPPMYRLDKDISRSMQVDTIFSVESGESFTLPNYGLYFIQSDTTSYSGISIRSEEKFFPKMVTMEDIIDPVIYLTTSQEIDRLKKNDNQKEAFEKFWLNLSESEDQASRLIREYFEQVELANSLFSNYKEGWKTDMGMIYIIFGPPAEVSNNGETESWYYGQQGPNTPAIVFNFLHLKSVFTQQHYLLIRDKQYKNSWFKVIDDWRRGRINR